MADDSEREKHHTGGTITGEPQLMGEIPSPYTLPSGIYMDVSSGESTFVVQDAGRDPAIGAVNVSVRVSAHDAEVIRSHLAADREVFQRVMQALQRDLA